MNETYIEIKNYETDRVKAKIKYLPTDVTYKILYKDDMQKYINYCITKYGKDFTKIYDKNKPSYLNKNK